MTGQRFRRIIIWVGLTLFLLACISPLLAAPTQVPQVLSPEQLGTPIAQTAAAAQTETVVYAPPTLTATLTPFPTGTQIVLSTTPTFFFALPTFTPLPTWTSTPGVIIQIPGGTGSASGNHIESPFTGKPWTCAIRGKSPAMGAVIERGVSFYVFITLMNTGTKTWTNNGIDFVYTGGLRSEGTRIQDLSLTTAPGQEITVKSLLVAPKKPDTYNTFWTLQVGKYQFCGFKYTFKVN